MATPILIPLGTRTTQNIVVDVFVDEETKHLFVTLVRS